MSDSSLAVIDREPSLLEVIASAARDPKVDIDKMQALLAMKERIDARNAETEFARAMQACQEEMRAITRDAVNSHTNSKYARLETIDAKIRPIYTRHGFSLSFDSPSTEGANITVTCTASHIAGHSRLYHLSGGLDGAGAQGKANKTPIQALGSSVSYLRRYLKCMIFDVILTNEDNDGNRTETTALISEGQADGIEDMMTEIGMDAASRSKFLEYMGVKTVADIRAADYRKAVTALETKRRKVGK